VIANIATTHQLRVRDTITTSEYHRREIRNVHLVVGGGRRRKNFPGVKTIYKSWSMLIVHAVGVDQGMVVRLANFGIRTKRRPGDE
jgi:hypothetical protein